MNRLWLFTAVAVLVLGGCADDSSGTPQQTPASTASFVNGTQGALNSTIQLTGAVAGYQDMAAAYKPGSVISAPEAFAYQKLGELLALRHRIPGQQKVTPVSCSTSGSSDVTSPDDPLANPYVVTITFTACDNGSNVTNGTVQLSVTTNADNSTTFAILIGDGDTAVEASDLVSTDSNGGTVTLSIAMTGTDAADSKSGSFTLNGVMEAANSDRSLVVPIVANNLSITWSESATTRQETVNGSLSVGLTLGTFTYSRAVTMTNLQRTETLSDGSYTLNGTVQLATSPADCADGTFTITTVTPIMENGGVAVAGSIQVNGTTVDYLSDGSVQITTSSGTTVYTQAQLNAGICT